MTGRGPGPVLRAEGGVGPLHSTGQRGQRMACRENPEPARQAGNVKAQPAPRDGQEHGGSWRARGLLPSHSSTPGAGVQIQAVLPPKLPLRRFGGCGVGGSIKVLHKYFSCKKIQASLNIPLTLLMPSPVLTPSDGCPQHLRENGRELLVRGLRPACTAWAPLTPGWTPVCGAPPLCCAPRAAGTALVTGTGPCTPFPERSVTTGL